MRHSYLVTGIVTALIASACQGTFTSSSAADGGVHGPDPADAADLPTAPADAAEVEADAEPPPPPPLPDASLEPTTFEGGSIFLPACSYAVKTRAGASEPRLGEAIFGTDPEPVRIHLGLAGPAATSMTVQWSTRDQATRATLVQYGTASVDEHTVEGLTFLYRSGDDGEEGPLVRVHEVHLCGLAPDTTYLYRVGGKGADGSERWSAAQTFRTAPDLAADPSASITALVMGDSRGGYATLGALLALGDQIAAPDVVLFTGDAVTHGDDQGDWDAFFTAAEPVLRRVPILFAHGNHEDNQVHFYSQVSQARDEATYSADLGPLHVVVMNDTPEDDDDLDGSLRDFLDADLAAHAGAPWKVAVHHRALYSSSNHGPQLDLQAAWGSVYDAHHVDLVLNGHDHNYERSYPLKAGHRVDTPAEGTVYVVAGAAGAPLYGNGSGSWTAKSESSSHLVVMTVRAGELRLVARRKDGSVLDEITLHKP